MEKQFLCWPGIVLGAGDGEINEKETASSSRDPSAQKSVHPHVCLPQREVSPSPPQIVPFLL